ncbi:MAG: hypothetical protein KDE19_18670, partial [Caldilineaceae bacterium]|nr:hypothetical protein [Caldilineaceae bacterium]
YQGVILTHQMVTKLTQRLNETGAYVKRVVENPARTDKTNANVTNHFWDLVGRSYEGHYPIDFHLVLTGKQDREQNDASSVSSEIHVHGLVTDEEMQKRVKKVRDELQKVVDDILEQMPSSTPSSVSTDFPSNAKDTQNGSATQLVSQISELLHQLNDVLHHDSR